MSKESTKLIDSDEQEVSSKIREMARLTVLSNKINPVQEKNLKTHPFVFFNGLNSVKIKYDIMHRKTVDDEPVLNSSIISYDLDIDTTADNNHLEKRFKALENAARTLLWKDIKIEIFFNKKIVYKSEDNE